ncbi:hypothetical protein BH10ACI4_BH10ACI4_06830 [soil metagenome]
MNIMFVLVAMTLLCAAIGLYVGIGNQDEERRLTRRAGKLSLPAGRRAEQTAFPAGWRSALPHRKMLMAFTTLTALSLFCGAANAQKVIHARAGQIVAINKAAKTISLKVADGSTVLFEEVATPEPNLAFAREIREKTTPAATFDKVGDEVVVFYFGFNTPTAVAIKDLGPGSVSRSTGSVANFERHQRLLTVKTEAAEPQKLVVTDETVVDTPSGLVKPGDYHPSKGEPVRCISGLQKDSQVALLIAPN